jgi:hypothetical protein
MIAYISLFIIPSGITQTRCQKHNSGISKCNATNAKADNLMNTNIPKLAKDSM